MHQIITYHSPVISKLVSSNYPWEFQRLTIKILHGFNQAFQNNLMKEISKNWVLQTSVKKHHINCGIRIKIRKRIKTNKNNNISAKKSKLFNYSVFDLQWSNSLRLPRWMPAYSCRFERLNYIIPLFPPHWLHINLLLTKSKVYRKNLARSVFHVALPYRKNINSSLHGFNIMVKYTELAIT